MVIHHSAFIITVCPELSAPTNGNITLSDGTNVGSVATYTCNEGYELSVTSTRFCRSGSRAWTGIDPTCDRESIQLT